MNKHFFKHKLFVVFMSTLLIAPSSFAAGWSGARKILEIGCHNDSSGVCFITVDGAPVGPSSCNSNSIRWDAQSTVGGKNAMALLSAAYLASKPIGFYVLDNCFAAQPGYPTFGYFVLQ